MTGKLLLTACSHVIAVFIDNDWSKTKAYDGFRLESTLIRLHYVTVVPVNWSWGYECRIQMATATFFFSFLVFILPQKHFSLSNHERTEEEMFSFSFFPVLVLIPSQTEPRLSLRDVAARRFLRVNASVSGERRGNQGESPHCNCCRCSVQSFWTRKRLSSRLKCSFWRLFFPKTHLQIGQNQDTSPFFF